jgi:preprotein translocase subunit SecG
MTAIIITVHVIVCIALILIVLLQTGRGADIGSAFGAGSSQTVFGSSGPAGFLTRLTTIAAIIFMLTSLSLSYFSGSRSTKSIMTETPKETQPITPEVDSDKQGASETQKSQLP